MALCPTGALSYRTPWPKPGPLPLEWAPSVCNLCPLTCQVTAGRIGGHLACVLGREAPPAFGHLCKYGRFDLLAAHASPARIAHPLIRKEGGLARGGWEQAMDRRADAIGDIREKHGAAALAGLALGRGSLEEMYLFGKLVRLGLFTNNLDFMSPRAERPQTGQLRGPSGRLGGPAQISPDRAPGPGAGGGEPHFRPAAPFWKRPCTAASGTAAGSSWWVRMRTWPPGHRCTSRWA